MQLTKSSNTSASVHRNRTLAYVFIFIIVAVVGLAYVKWVPYFNKANLAATNHSIGDSILGNTAALPDFSWTSAFQYAMSYFKSVWQAAILGILLGSLVQVLIPTNWLLKVLGKTSFGSTAAAGVASLPGMMCTCCAAPLAVGLRKKNVSIGAALAFWLGNPTLNPATLIFMTFVLSWKFTVLRVIFGVILVFGVSYLANRFAPNVQSKDLNKIIEKAEIEEKNEEGFLVRWIKALGKMSLYIIPAYIVTVLVMGALQSFLFPQLNPALANSFLAIILFAITGMLFVIPTAAEIPIIQTFMNYGMSGGPAATLLITLPSISLPSLVLVGKAFPKKALFFVAGSVVLLGILSGIIGMYIL